MRIHKNRFTALTIITISSALFLSACGGQQKETTASSSQVKQTSKVSSTKKKSLSSSKSSSMATSSKASIASSSSSSKENEPAKPQDQAVTKNQPATQEQQPAPTQAEQPAVSSHSNRDQSVYALVNGDFSKAAGTWGDDLGNRVTIDAAGNFTVQFAGLEPRQFTVFSYNYTLDNGQYQALLESPAHAASEPGIQLTVGDDGHVQDVQILQRGTTYPVNALNRQN